MAFRPRVTRLAWLVGFSLLTACSGENAGDLCILEDADGIIGGRYTFVVTVDDGEVVPTILKAQNSASVTLTVKNEGTKPVCFAIDCVPTHNQDGCAQESCFPESSAIEAVEPGESETVLFEVPKVEGIYTFRAQDAEGQFIVQ